MSKRSLEVLGGVMTDSEATVFVQQAGAREAIAVRRWDDRAESSHAQTVSVDMLKSMVLQFMQTYRKYGCHDHSFEQKKKNVYSAQLHFWVRKVQSIFNFKFQRLFKVLSDA